MLGRWAAIGQPARLPARGRYRRSRRGGQAHDRRLRFGTRRAHDPACPPCEIPPPGLRLPRRPGERSLRRPALRGDRRVHARGGRAALRPRRAARRPRLQHGDGRRPPRAAARLASAGAAAGVQRRRDRRADGRSRDADAVFRHDAAISAEEQSRRRRRLRDDANDRLRRLRRGDLQTLSAGDGRRPGLPRARCRDRGRATARGARRDRRRHGRCADRSQGAAGAAQGTRMARPWHGLVRFSAAADSADGCAEAGSGCALLRVPCTAPAARSEPGRVEREGSGRDDSNKVLRSRTHTISKGLGGSVPKRHDYAAAPRQPTRSEIATLPQSCTPPARSALSTQASAWREASDAKSSAAGARPGASHRRVRSRRGDETAVPGASHSRPMLRAACAL
jgi:hypothetical protein